MAGAAASNDYTPPTYPQTMGHPSPLWMLFMTEFWERFAFYGIRWALALYIVAQFAESQAGASKLYGAYLALVYAAALFGGFVDAAGGGGWGPVVTSSLIGSGGDPRTTIGSVNFAEFFLTLSSAASFILLAGELDTWLMVAGLVFGGMFAAPFAAYLCKRIPARTLMTIVGCLITLISAFNIYKALA